MTFHPVENVSLLYLTSSTSQITCPAFEELHSIKDALYLTSPQVIHLSNPSTYIHLRWRF